MESTLIHMQKEYVNMSYFMGTNPLWHLKTQIFRLKKENSSFSFISYTSLKELLPCTH